MGGELLDGNGLAEVWDRIKRRSIPVKPITENEYERLDDSDKFKEILYLCLPETDGSPKMYYMGLALGGNTDFDYDWWSPKMTDDTTPYPFVATGNEYSTSRSAYCAFDGVDSTYFRSANADENGWLQFDFGKKVYTSGIRLIPGSTDALRKRFPKSFVLEGSDNLINWHEIYSEDGSEYPEMPPASEVLVSRDYYFPRIAYRYYRITCHGAYDYEAYGSQMAIHEWKFYKQVTEDNGVPSGGIIIWSGSANSIPSGWRLCDGSGGTPDLRDRFIIGAGNLYERGNTGGSETVVLKTENMPRHMHDISSIYGASAAINKTSPGSAYRQVLQADPSLGNLAKSTTVASGSDVAHENMPPYYALCYIMKL